MANDKDSESTAEKIMLFFTNESVDQCDSKSVFKIKKYISLVVHKHIM